MVELIDQLKGEYGARSRGRVLELLLQDLLDPGESSTEPVEAEDQHDSAPAASTTSTDDVTSLVLIRPGSLQQNSEERPSPDSGALPSNALLALICRVCKPANQSTQSNTPVSATTGCRSERSFGLHCESY